MGILWGGWEYFGGGMESVVVGMGRVEEDFVGGWRMVWVGERG